VIEKKLLKLVNPPSTLDGKGLAIVDKKDCMIKKRLHDKKKILTPTKIYAIKKLYCIGMVSMPINHKGEEKMLWKKQ